MSGDARPDAAIGTEISAENDESGSLDVVAPEVEENAPETQSDSNADVFPRHYVEELRGEAAKHRERGKAAEERADALAKRLHLALVRVTGRLENPADLPFDAEHLEDDDTLTAAIDAILKERPYLKARRLSGDIGQGQRGKGTALPSFAELLK